MVDKEGNTYERSAILKWLETSQSSPITRNSLSLSDLVPNRAILDIIQNLPVADPLQSQRLPVPPPTVTSPNANKISKKMASTSIQDSFVHVSAPEVPLSLSFVDSHVLIDVHPPSSSTRSPNHIVLVVDVSGSMSSSASVKDGSSENSALSILDITKHAAKTVASILNPSDILSLVTFTDSASVIFEALAMTPENKKSAIAKIDALSPLRSTNIWDGLSAAMNIIKRHPTSNPTMSNVFLLTDGVPNIVPPRGHIPMLQRFLDENPSLSFTINTFGFGYSLDSELLLDLARVGNGNYSFIPDASFVGTVFIHAVSNVLATFGQNATISIEVPSQLMDSAKVLGSTQLPVSKTSWGFQVKAASLQYEQTRTVVIEVPGLKSAEGFSATLKYKDLEDTTSPTAVTTSTSRNVPPATDAKIHILRLKAVDAVMESVSKATNDTKPSNELLAPIITSLKDVNPAPPLLADVSGQMSEALSTFEYYRRWGRHYLRSISRAHALQNCTNFKDPGVQPYGSGALFTALRDECDKIFMSLPPPKPSRDPSAQRMSSAAYTRSYYNSSNPCFSPDSLVLMGDGSTKPCADIVFGDVLATDDGGTASVKLIVKTLTKDGKTDLVEFPNGLKSTPYHPVVNPSNGKWTFPRDIYPISENVECEAVYSYVLDTPLVSMIINGTTCIALGHGITGDPVASHPYLGTMAIVDDLEKCSDDSGLVTLNYGAMKRGEHNNTNTLIQGIIPERVITSAV